MDTNIIARDPELPVLPEYRRAAIPYHLSERREKSNVGWISLAYGSSENSDTLNRCRPPKAINDGIRPQHSYTVGEVQ